MLVFQALLMSMQAGWNVDILVFCALVRSMQAGWNVDILLFHGFFMSMHAGRNMDSLYSMASYIHEVGWNVGYLCSMIRICLCKLGGMYVCLCTKHIIWVQIRHGCKLTPIGKVVALCMITIYTLRIPSQLVHFGRRLYILEISYDICLLSHV